MTLPQTISTAKGALARRARTLPFLHAPPGRRISLPGVLAPVCVLRDGILDAIGPLLGTKSRRRHFLRWPWLGQVPPLGTSILDAPGGHSPRPDGNPASCYSSCANPVRAGSKSGIGAGENLAFLPPDWTVYGVDIARTQLELCRDRHPEMAGRLAWAEGEDLPFEDATFDACWSVGGFNYYSDHERTLREMRRVTKPGGPIVVADELPTLHRTGLGHLIGVRSLDAWWLCRLGLDRDFVDMVLNFDVDLPALFERVWPARPTAPDLARAGLLCGRDKCLLEIKHQRPILGDSRCQLRAPKKRSTPIRNSTSWMKRHSGIARGHGDARAAGLPCGTNNRPPGFAARPVRPCFR